MCFTPEYRLSTEALYPAAVNDLKSALRWIRASAKKYNVDSNKIAVLGFSAGGQLAALLGVTAGNSKFEAGECNVRSSSAVNAIIDLDGTLSFVHPESGEGDDTKRTSAATYWFGYSKKENLKLWEEASPLTYVDKNTPPTLFINSSVDRMHAGRNDFLKVLEENNIYSEVKTFPGSPHSFPLFDPWFEPTLKYTDEFLKKVFGLKQKTMKCILFIAVVLVVSFQGFSQTSNPNQYKYVFTVAKDGSGDYKYIQDAIDAMRVYPLRRITLYIKNGVYNEKIVLPSDNTDVTFIGESVEKTIISFNDYSGRGKLTTFTSYTAKISGNRFIAQNITFTNSAGTVGQALALYVDADKAVFKNCRFIGNQDTIYAAGENARQYFVDCYIEGTTDFIFGPSTAVFQNCTIKGKSNSYITAANTPQGKKFGFVFLDCKIIADSAVTKLFLGRPWRAYSRTAFIRCQLPKQIAPDGWNNWGNVENEKTAFYAEYKNSGEGAGTKSRALWSKQLGEAEAKEFTVGNIFANNNSSIQGESNWFSNFQTGPFEWPAKSKP